MDLIIFFIFFLAKCSFLWKWAKRGPFRHSHIAILKKNHHILMPFLSLNWLWWGLSGSKYPAIFQLSFIAVELVQEEDFVDLMQSYHDVPNIPLYLWYNHPFVLVVGIIKIGPSKQILWLTWNKIISSIIFDIIMFCYKVKGQICRLKYLICVQDQLKICLN